MERSYSRVASQEALFHCLSSELTQLDSWLISPTFQLLFSEIHQKRSPFLLLLIGTLALLWTPKNKYHCPAGGLFEGVVLFLVPTNPTHMLTRHHPLFWFCIRPIALTTGPTYHHILPSTIHSMSYVKRKTTSLVSLQLQVDKGRFHCLIIQIMLPSSLSCRRTRNPWILIC